MLGVTNGVQQQSVNICQVVGLVFLQLTRQREICQIEHLRIREKQDGVM
jgi:hypothetical protein